MADILLVDDDIALTRLLSMILRLKGHRTESATNGHKALDYVRERCPDLIILDLEMPSMNGRTFFRQLEMRLRKRRPPVLLLSAFGARTAQEELGAEGAMDKPFDPDSLLTQVDDLLQGSRP